MCQPKTISWHRDVFTVGCYKCFSCDHVGAEPVDGPGPRLQDHRQALCKCLTSLLPYSGNEFCLLQPLYLRLTAQQGAHSPERVRLSQLPEADGGKNNIHGLIQLSVHIMAEPCPWCKRFSPNANVNVWGVQEKSSQLLSIHVSVYFHHFVAQIKPPIVFIKMFFFLSLFFALFTGID